VGSARRSEPWALNVEYEQNARKNPPYSTFRHWHNTEAKRTHAEMNRPIYTRRYMYAKVPVWY